MDNPRNAPTQVKPGPGTSYVPGYGFIRSSDTWGVDSIPWADMAAAGLTPALASNDPHLAEAMAAGRNAGQNPAIWIPAGGEGLPEDYAARIVDLVKQYGPAAIIPNIEAIGKGYEGSAGWNWNQRMVNELVRLGMPKKMAVAVMGEKDFNYKAYTEQGVNVLPEMFGPNTATDLYDPNQRRQDLINLGVPESMISDLLAPTQAGPGRGSVFTIDDLKPDELRALAQAGIDPQTVLDTANAAPAPDAAPPVAAQDDFVGPGGGFREVPDMPDAQNPAAIRYSKHRLALLAQQGITPARYGLEGLDPTAQWRALSAIAGAQKAVSSGHAAQYQIPTDAPDSVRDYATKIVNAAQTPDTAPPGDDVIRPGQVPSQPVTTPAISPSVRQMVTDMRRNPAGQLSPDVKRIGPMQQAIHTSALMARLRGTGSVGRE